MPRKKAEPAEAVEKKKAEQKKKPAKKAEKKKDKTDNLIPVRTKEEAREKGRRGGIKSGEVRRAKKDARESVRYMLDLAAKGGLKDNLTQLGFPATEQTNMAALHARLFAMAMSGNLDAYKELMKVGGFDVDDRRKDRELEAKIAAISNNPEARVSVGLGGDDVTSSDVIIYLPEIEQIDDGEGKSDDNPQTEAPDQE